MLGYTCKYTPVELLSALGGCPQMISDEAEDFEYAQGVSHINMCCHIKAFIEEVHRSGVGQVVLVNCCDSVRRAYDVLQGEDLDFLYLLDLPHGDDRCAKLQFRVSS